jgi:helix-turn-helix protein
MRYEVTDCHFNLTAAARYLGKSVRWLQYQLNGPHAPPAYKVGKSWIFKKTELDSWLRQFRTTPDVDRLVDETVREVLGK